MHQLVFKGMLREIPQAASSSIHPMLFLVVEHFRAHDARSVYRRFRDQGRLAPDGLTYVGSWVTADLGRCFQIMECADVRLLQQWVARWSDLIEFEIVPVLPGKDTADTLGPFL